MIRLFQALLGLTYHTKQVILCINHGRTYIPTISNHKISKFLSRLVVNHPTNASLILNGQVSRPTPSGCTAARHMMCTSMNFCTAPAQPPRSPKHPHTHSNPSPSIMSETLDEAIFTHAKTQWVPETTILKPEATEDRHEWADDHSELSYWYIVLGIQWRLPSLFQSRYVSPNVSLFGWTRSA